MNTMSRITKRKWLDYSQLYISVKEVKEKNGNPELQDLHHQVLK